MSRTRTRVLSALFVLALTPCVVSSAEARKWRSWSYEGHGYSARFGFDDRRGARAEGRKSRPERGRQGTSEGLSTSTDGRSTRAVESAEPTNPSTSGGAFGAVIEGLARACLQQAALFQSWPFDDISRIAAPDDAQRGALDTLRAATAAAAEKLSANCPQDVPVPAWARLEAVEQSIDAVSAAFAAVEPTLQSFYAALDDEQKARLLRDLTFSKAQTRMDERAAEQRPTQRTGGSNTRAAGANPWVGICENLTAALRGWPTSEIERGVRLSEPQRVAFYEFVTFSLKAAETLAAACPADTALTPVGRMKVLRARLAAVRQATTAIHPALTRFYETLDQGQRVRFAAMP
jgi:LTXXQ motif family protein